MISERVKALIEIAGQKITYQSQNSGSYNAETGIKTQSYTDYEVYAAIRDYTAKELGGLIIQGDREAKIAADSLTITPKAEDKIIINDKLYTVKAARTDYAKQEKALIVLTIRG